LLAGRMRALVRPHKYLGLDAQGRVLIHADADLSW